VFFLLIEKMPKPTSDEKTTTYSHGWPGEYWLDQVRSVPLKGREVDARYWQRLSEWMKENNDSLSLLIDKHKKKNFDNVKDPCEERLHHNQFKRMLQMKLEVSMEPFAMSRAHQWISQHPENDNDNVISKDPTKDKKRKPIINKKD